MLVFSVGRMGLGHVRKRNANGLITLHVILGEEVNFLGKEIINIVNVDSVPNEIRVRLMYLSLELINNRGKIIIIIITFFSQLKIRNMLRKILEFNITIRQ